MSKYDQYKKIEDGEVLCKHLWKKDKDGDPLVTKISEEAFKRLPAYTGPDPMSDDTRPTRIVKQGWTEIKPSALIKPKAASEAEAKAESKETPKAASSASKPAEKK